MFGKNKGTEPVAETVKPQESFDTHTTKIGAGVTMVGTFEGRDPVEINGTLLGDIKSSSTVRITEVGMIDGNGTVKNLEVSGRIKGTFTCLNTSRFSPTGKMSGILTTKELETAPGTRFCGTLNLAIPQEKEQ